jgi:hypothetical protein
VYYATEQKGTVGVGVGIQVLRILTRRGISAIIPTCCQIRHRERELSSPSVLELKVAGVVLGLVAQRTSSVISGQIFVFLLVRTFHRTL